MNIKNFLYTILLISNILFAQKRSTIKLKENYNIKYLDINNGLANNSVTSIYKDKRGLMWIGTYDGVSRYNAYDFVNYRHQPNDTITLINNKITCINGTLNNIWIGTKSGISVYNYLTNQFKRKYIINPITKEKRLVNNQINNIKEFKSNIYVATLWEGLMFAHKDDEYLTKIPILIDGKTTWNYNAYGLDFDKQGNLWASVDGVGLVTMKAGNKKLEVVCSKDVQGWCVTSDGFSNLWVGHEEGIYKYNTVTKTYVNYTNELIAYSIKDIYCNAKKNELWIATDGNGVVVYNLKTGLFHRLSDSKSVNEQGLTSNAISTLYQDNKDRIWIGTLRGGVDILENKKSPFTTISKKQNVENTLPSNFILSFSEQDENHIWIGTDGGGISLWNRTNDTFTNYFHDPFNENSLPNNFVTGVVSDKKGVWIGTYGGGISFFNTKTKKFKKYTLSNPYNNNAHNYIWALFLSKEGEVWASAPGGRGLYKYNKRKDAFGYVDVGVQGVISITQDEKNDFWVGTFNQLIKLDLKTLHHKKIKMQYPVQSIYVHSSDKILIGTEGGGLLVFNPKTDEKKFLTEVDGVSNNSILNIERDNQGLYWLSTYNGITKFNSNNNSIVQYYDVDGLQSNQFNYNASLKLSTGEILMGGIKGFNVIDTKKPSVFREFPKLMITSIKINNKPLSQFGKTSFGLNKLELPFDDSTITVEYAGLDYSFSEKIAYAYFLDGWDTQWHKVGNMRIANYSKLTEGDYVLKIKSTNADGEWNTKILTLPITILSPWYRTTLAYFLYALIFVLGILFVDRYQRGQAELKYEIQLSKDLAAQEKALNENKSTFFTNISHEFRSPLTMIINPLKDIINHKNPEIDLSVIDVVYRNSRRLLSLVDQLLLFRKTETETGKLMVSRMELVGLCNEVFTCFTNHAQTKKIAYSFNSNVEEFFVYADRQKLEIMLFNLIANALKFTEKEEGKVVVDLNITGGNEIFLSIVDNGKGILEDDKQKIFDLYYQTEKKAESNRKGFGIGLYLVKEFVEQHKGTVACIDTKNGGTTFKITLLKGKEHFGDIEITETKEEKSVGYVEEVIEDETIEGVKIYDEISEEFVKKSKTILVVDDNNQIRKYIEKILTVKYHVVTAENAEIAIGLIKKTPFDLIVSDVVMGEISGVDFCKYVKTTEELKHIPVILLSGGSKEEVKLKSAKVGADDYLTKPFDKDYLLARINAILTRRESVQNYLLNTVTKKIRSPKLSDEDKLLLDRVVEVMETKMESENFNIKTLALEIGMSHSLLYKKIKKITGKSVTEFTRGVRLRKVATLLITTDLQINQVASTAGFGDLKYFRKQFQQFYGMNPSEFKKKYQNVKDKKYILNEGFWKSS